MNQVEQNGGKFWKNDDAPSSYKSIPAFIHDKCEKFGNKVFLTDNLGNNISYENFYEQIQNKRSLLEQNHCFIQNSTFSIIAPNSLDYLYFLFALQKANNVAVNLNPALTSYEIEQRLNLADVRLLVTTHQIYETLQSILPNTKINSVVLFNPAKPTDDDISVLHLENSSDAHSTKAPTDAAFFQFTGGTSGTTKAAIISHSNVLNNIRQIDEHVEQFLSVKQPCVIIAFPFYHIFSIVFNVLYFLGKGGTCILFSDLRNTDQIIELFQKHPVTCTVGVNTWYNKLMNHPNFPELDLSGVQFSFAGGEYVPVSTKKKWQKHTGKQLYSAYGLTETSALAIVSPFGRENILDSIGVPLPGTNVTLLDEAFNEIQEENTPGEIALKGPQVTSGYYNNEEETQNAFVNGWFRTGDVAYRFNGHYYKLIDRKKDMITVSGNKVYPNEVEEVILQLRQVFDVGVVAKPSEQSGEEVAACIVLKAGQTLDDETIRSHCRHYLTRFKVPKYIYQYSELPKSPIGKTFRYKLREDISNYQ